MTLVCDVGLGLLVIGLRIARYVGQALSACVLNCCAVRLWLFRLDVSAGFLGEGGHSTFGSGGFGGELDGYFGTIISF